MKTQLPVIGITAGDPSGIGPEIVLKSFLKPGVRNRKLLVIGDYDIMLAAHKLLKIKEFRVIRSDRPENMVFSSGLLNILDLGILRMDKLIPGKVQASSGNAAFRYLEKAVELASSKKISAIVTAPLNKEALYLAGHKYPGHTEILAGLTGTRDYAMLLYHKRLSVIHVSTHISLLEAVSTLRKARIEKVIELADQVMRKLVKRDPLIAVAGINPHAGENGLFGEEELEEIFPAVIHMKRKGFNVHGPFPPDTVFLKAAKGAYDVVVAMYHDQGHIPLKLLGFDRGVNVTAGLPFIRTSVDHGTAFEIAWKGVASESSMVEAIRLAARLVP